MRHSARFYFVEAAPRVCAPRCFGDFFVLQEFSFPARMISESLEVEKQRENETAKGGVRTRDSNPVP